MKTKLIIAILIFLTVSCSDDVFEEQKPITYTEEESRVLEEITRKTPKLTEDEAVQKALEAIGSISPSAILTKGGKTKTIKNSRALTVNSAVTRSGINQQDTLAYIFNFDNDEGFAIVAADIRVPEKLLAYTETGNLEQDTDNPGLAVFLGYAENYITKSIELAESRKDSIYQIILHKFREEHPELTEKKTTKGWGDIPPGAGGPPLGGGGGGADDSWGPLVPEGETPWELPYDVEFVKINYDWQNVEVIRPLTAVEWGQGEHYNTYTRANGCGGNAPYTGCVAVAVAQIMAHWKYPQEIKPYTFNWNEMVRYTGNFNRNNEFGNKWTASVANSPDPVKNDIARLMERIGFNVKMEYRCDGSGADSDDAVGWMQRMGFSGGEHSGYDIERIRKSLLNNCIVYADGCSQRTKFLGITVKYEGCHAWNYDGYIKQMKKMEVRHICRDKITGKIIDIKTVTSTEYRSLVHCNWGWDGRRNGYYFSGVFDTNVSSPPLISGTRNSSDGYYQYRLNIYTNLKR